MRCEGRGTVSLDLPFICKFDSVSTARLLKEPAKFVEVKDIAKNAGVAWQILHGVTLFGGTVTFLYTSSKCRNIAVKSFGLTLPSSIHAFCSSTWHADPRDSRIHLGEYPCYDNGDHQHQCCHSDLPRGAAIAVGTIRLTCCLDEDWRIWS